MEDRDRCKEYWETEPGGSGDDESLHRPPLPPECDGDDGGGGDGSFEWDVPDSWLLGNVTIIFAVGGSLVICVCFIFLLHRYCCSRYCKKKPKVKPQGREIKATILQRITDSMSRVTSRKARAMLFALDKEEQDTKCAICLDSLLHSTAGRRNKKKNVIGFVKKCKHLFHFDCIWGWITTNSSCPICRTSIHASKMDIKAVSGSALQKIMDKYATKSSKNKRRSAHSNNDITSPEHFSVPENLMLITNNVVPEDTLSTTNNACGTGRRFSERERDSEVILDVESLPQEGAPTESSSLAPPREPRPQGPGNVSNLRKVYEKL